MMLEKLRQSFIAKESEIKTRIAEKAKVLQLNSLDQAKKVVALLPCDHGLEPPEIEIFTLFLAERQTRVYTQNDARGQFTSGSIDLTRRASENVRENLQRDIEEKIEEFCNLKGLAFAYCGWIDWRAALRSMAQNLAIAYDKLNINPFTDKPPKKELQEFAKLTNELAKLAAIERNFMLPACA